MRASASSLLSGCVLLAALLLLSGSATAAEGSRLNALFSQLTHSAAAQPDATAYAFRNYTYTNCDASLPVQLDEGTRMVVQGDIGFMLLRFHTSVAINGGYVTINSTLTPAGGGSNSSSSLYAFGIERDLLSPASLPVAAGTTDLRFHALGSLRGSPLGHYTQLVHMYDARQTAIGCVWERLDLVQA